MAVLVAGLGGGTVATLLGAFLLALFGSLLLSERAPDFLVVASAAAVGVCLVGGAVRWGAAGLEELAGAQAVFGPTVLVGPPQAAAGAWIAALAGAVALGVAAGVAPPARTRIVGWLPEVLAGAAALATVLWGMPARWWEDPARSAGSVAQWALATLVVGLVATASGLLAARGTAWRWGAVVAAVVGAAGGVGLTAATLA